MVILPVVILLFFVFFTFFGVKAVRVEREEIKFLNTAVLPFKSCSKSAEDYFMSYFISTRPFLVTQIPQGICYSSIYRLVLLIQYQTYWLLTSSWFIKGCSCCYSHPQMLTSELLLLATWRSKPRQSGRSKPRKGRLKNKWNTWKLRENCPSMTKCDAL